MPIWYNEGLIADYKKQYNVVTNDSTKSTLYARFGKNFAKQNIIGAISAWTSDMVHQMHIECACTKDLSKEFLQSLPQIIIKSYEREHVIREWKGLTILSLLDIRRNYNRKHVRS